MHYYILIYRLAATWRVLARLALQTRDTWTSWFNGHFVYIVFREFSLSVVTVQNHVCRPFSIVPLVKRTYSPSLSTRFPFRKSIPRSNQSSFTAPCFPTTWHIARCIPWVFPYFSFSNYFTTEIIYWHKLRLTPSIRQARSLIWILPPHFHHFNLFKTWILRDCAGRCSRCFMPNQGISGYFSGRE